MKGRGLIICSQNRWLNYAEANCSDKIFWCNDTISIQKKFNFISARATIWLVRTFISKVKQLFFVDH
ncbi:MAG: hypothetical protein A2W91_16730 [Bacteroidetes bacterium GWF2_38_335]|nr:MAG: hypothetical protein A2W91_16730 [Bacteroidetes bacterium GWF2_38_335]OFY81331.1 MAG: hypothetical protein A2281_07705 [Bacteroidetes bacterium RIFOXYA12_FULL_38_20]HBS85453.1 hypothetical protein [Bacteroidales bacterium]